MDNMSDTQETNDGCSGCSGMFLWLVALPILLVVVLAAIGLVFFDDEDDVEMIPLTGEIIVNSAEVCSENTELDIRASDAPTTTITFSGNGLWPCRLPLDLDIPLAETYTFAIDGVNSQTVRRSLIDTIGPDGDTVLEVRLSW